MAHLRVEIGGCLALGAVMGDHIGPIAAGRNVGLQDTQGNFHLWSLTAEEKPCGRP